MFFLGCAVGYFLVFPFTFRFLTEYQLSPLITNQISLTSYMGNFLMLIFVMGIVFELPLLAWLLSKLGLVTKTFFRKYRKHAVVVLLVLSAVITPTGDPFTLMIVFLPLYLLYEPVSYTHLRAHENYPAVIVRRGHPAGSAALPLRLRCIPHRSPVLRR